MLQEPVSSPDWAASGADAWNKLCTTAPPCPGSAPVLCTEPCGCSGGSLPYVGQWCLCTSETVLWGKEPGQSTVAGRMWTVVTEATGETPPLDLTPFLLDLVIWFFPLCHVGALLMNTSESFISEQGTPRLGTPSKINVLCQE